MLQGCRVVVDVQHLFRPHKPNDRGSVYRLANGTRTTEGSAALIYAASIKAWLEARGAKVLTNNPALGVLVGHYSTRNRSVSTFDPHAYLACHVNAGGGRYTLAMHMTMRPAAAVLGARITSSVAAAFPNLISEGQVWALSGSDRGAVCIREVPSQVAAVVCEPFFGDYPPHQAMLAAPELARLGAAIGEGVLIWWQGREVFAGPIV